MKFESLPGYIRYEEGRAIQHALVDARARDEIEDTILFLEHAPVVTRGRGLQQNGETRERHMPLMGPLPADVEFADSERGGDLTYHGPGQLVVYPIIKLNGSSPLAAHHDVTGFLRQFEKIFIDDLIALGLPARADTGATGVWVGDKKLVSIGIAVRKWVTYHGAAINIVNDLKPFHSISPCGFSPGVMTRLSSLTTVPQEWRTWIEGRLTARFSAELSTRFQTEASGF
ncbi:lipoyl(octanoyl) transferase LipB [bacterium]|jgi:lipoyl(octanoyl) transferase|nr:lipoyl(octanoyl) transferase LipB [bacterium]